MLKTGALLYAGVICAFLVLTGSVASGLSLAEEEKAKLPEGKINIETLVEKKGLKIVSMTKPLYPPEAKAKGIEGLVKIDVVVGKDGSVLEANALSGPDILKTSALEAVRQWKYEPPGVDVKVTVHVNYKLASKARPAEPKTKS